MHTCFQRFISVINLLHSIETVDNALNSLCLERGKHSMWLFSENFCCVEPQRKGCSYMKRSQRRSSLTLWANATLVSIVLYLLFLPSETYLLLVSSTQRNTVLPPFQSKKRTGFQGSGLFLPCKCLQNTFKWIAKQKLFEKKWQKNCQERQMSIKKFFCQTNYPCLFQVRQQKRRHIFLNYLPGSVLHAFFHHKVVLCVCVSMQARRQPCSSLSCHW